MKVDLINAHFDDQVFAMPEKDIRAMYKAVVAATKDGLTLKQIDYEPNQVIAASDHTLIKVDGPIFARHTFWSAFFGVTSTEWLCEQVQAADQRGKPIIIRYSSPGGDVLGMGECAGVIGATHQPVYSYAAAQAASAAFSYYAQGDIKFAHPMALVGSVGMYATKIRQDESGEDRLLISANVPNKIPDEEAQQKIINDLEKEMIAQIAAGYGIGSEDVIERFGQGAVFTARDAAKPEIGMVQRLINSPSELPKAVEIEMQLTAEQKAAVEAAGGIEALLKKSTATSASTTETPAVTDTDDAPPGVDVNSPQFATAVATAVKAERKQERERVRGIRAIEGAEDHPRTVARLIEEGATIEEAKARLSDVVADTRAAVGDDGHFSTDEHLDELEDSGQLDEVSRGKAAGRNDKTAQAKSTGDYLRQKRLGIIDGGKS